MDQRVIGRGRLYFEPENSARPGERYIGNTPSLQIGRKLKTEGSTKSVRGQLVAADPVVISEEHTLSFETDNLDGENLGLWFGENEVRRQHRVPFEKYIRVWKGRHYQLTENDDDLVGFGQIESVHVSVEANDALHAIEVDLRNGRIFVPLNSTISDGTTLFVTGMRSTTYSECANTVAAEIYGKLRYVSENPTATQLSIVWPRVSLAPEGEFDLKTRNTWGTIGFKGDVRKVSGKPYVQVYGWSSSAMWPGGPDLVEFLGGESELNRIVNVVMPSRGYPV